VSSAITSRLLKFSLIGAVGICVQLVILALLTAAGVGYLLATGLAVECAVLHNFLWHRGFTWSDRRRPGVGGFLVSLFRFHLGNGLISIGGNLLLMHVLVGILDLPLLPSNIAGISACFVANFAASDRWVFSLP
jgi:putative flippase GtrA